VRGRLVDLPGRCRIDGVHVVLHQAAQRHRFRDDGIVRRMGRHQVRQAHDADQGVGVFQAAARLVVVQHRIGQEGVEVPAFDQPGARFRVRDLQRALFDGAQVLVVACGEIEGVFLGRGGQQRQPADIVQQARQVGFLDVGILHALGQVARDHGGRQRMLPEGAQVGAAGMGEVIEGLEHRFADHQRLDHVGAKGDQRLFEAHAAAAGAMVGRAVGDPEDLAGHAGVFGNQRGQLLHAQIVGLQVLYQLDEYLRHGRQTGNQQAIANIMV